MARKSRKNVAHVMEVQPQKQEYFNVGAYVRLSAVDKKQKGDSIETQQAIIKAYVAAHPDLALRETYIDNGLSGMNFARPAFQKMLMDLECRKISCIICKDLSRLGRNAIDTGFYIEKYFPTHNIRFIAINDDYDSIHGQSGGLMVSLKNIVNESFALEVGRKTRATKGMHSREGSFTGRFAPYGYQKSPENRYQLIVDEEAAQIVARMFTMAANGQDARAIKDYLNEEGILPPRRYLQQKIPNFGKDNVGHEHWCQGTIYAILHNRVYCGDMVQGKSKMVDHVQKALPKSEWIVVENTHEPVVSRDVWDKVQESWAAPEKVRSYGENIFRGKIFCAHCGYTMQRKRHGKHTFGYACITRYVYGKHDCVQVSVAEISLREQFLSQLREKLTAMCESDSLSSEHDADMELQSVRQELGKKRGFLQGLYESLVLEHITNDEYITMKKGFEEEIAALSGKENRLWDVSIAANLRKTALQRASDCLENVRSVDDLNADVLAHFVERINVNQDKSIDIIWQEMEGC